MANFTQRQEQLRRDLEIMLHKTYGNNKTKMADALSIVPKVLSDFIEKGVVMQAEKYDNIVETLRSFNFSLYCLEDIASFVNLFEGLDIENMQSLEKLYHVTYKPDDVERQKLMKFFLEGWKLSDIKNLNIMHGKHDSNFIYDDREEGLIAAVSKKYADFFEKHEALASHENRLTELKNDFASYMFGYRAPSYFLDEKDTQKAVIIFMTGTKFQDIRKKILAYHSSDKTDTMNLDIDQITFCRDIGYDYNNDVFSRSFNKFLSPAKMKKN